MEKIKICTIVGATRNNSNTLHFVLRFLEHLKEELDNEVEVKIYNLNDYIIKDCIGCGQCLELKQCILDDNVERMKIDMQNSNIIIWASPVYMNGITGKMKTFIDRLHGWTKIFALRDKYGIILSTSSHKINEIFLSQYLIWIQNALGMINLGAYNICVDFPKELFSEQSEEIIGQFAFESIVNYRANYRRTSTLIEKIFLELRKSILLIKKYTPQNSIVHYWEKNNLIDCKNYQSYLNNLK